MGDLLSKDMLGDIVINIINIIVLFVVTRFLLYKPLKKFLDARKEKIASAQTEAENAKAEADKVIEEYNSLVMNAEDEKNRIITEAKKSAEDKAKEIIDNAEIKARDTISKSETDAKKIKEDALNEAKDEICDVAVAIAGKILARDCTNEDNKAIIDDFFKSDKESV